MGKAAAERRRQGRRPYHEVELARSVRKRASRRSRSEKAATTPPANTANPTRSNVAT